MTEDDRGENEVTGDGRGAAHRRSEANPGCQTTTSPNPCCTHARAHDCTGDGRRRVGIATAVNRGEHGLANVTRMAEPRVQRDRNHVEALAGTRVPSPILAAAPRATFRQVRRDRDRVGRGLCRAKLVPSRGFTEGRPHGGLRSQLYASRARCAPRNAEDGCAVCEAGGAEQPVSARSPMMRCCQRRVRPSAGSPIASPRGGSENEPSID